MKKLLSIMLAGTAAMSLTMTAFASDINTLPDGITIGKDEGTSLAGGLLTPGELYRFPIMLVKDGEGTQLEKGGKFRLVLQKDEGGTGLEYVKVVTVGTGYFADVKVAPGDTAKQNEHKYTLTYTEGDKVKHTKTFEFTSGHRYANIEDAVAGEAVRVSQKAPLYTSKQLEKLAELNGYKKVTFEGDDWRYTANVSGMGNVNFTSTPDPIDEVAKMFPEDDMKFISFPAGGSFKGSAELTVDLADFEGSFGEKVYAYRYLYGRLYKMPSTHNAEDGTITLGVTNLGRYVITDRAIKEATIVDPTGGTTGGGNNGESKPNPDTGTPFALAPTAVSLLAIAVMTITKKK